MPGSAEVRRNMWKTGRSRVRITGDGSLRCDLNPDPKMHAVVNAVIGAQRRLASLGNKIEQEYGKPIDRLFRETIRVILLGLRTPGTPVPRHPQRALKAGKARSRKRSS